MFDIDEFVASCEAALTARAAEWPVPGIPRVNSLLPALVSATR